MNTYITNNPFPPQPSPVPTNPQYFISNSDIAKQYDKFKDSAAGTVVSMLPITGTIMDGIELYRNPSLENALWFGTGAILDTMGGRIMGNIIKNSAKKNLAKLVAKPAIQREVNQVVLRDKTKDLAQQALKQSQKQKLYLLPLFNMDNVVQWGVNKYRDSKEDIPEKPKPMYVYRPAQDIIPITQRYYVLPR